MSKIDRNTSETLRVQQLNTIRDEWLAASTSTQRINRIQVRDSIRLLYATLDLKEPQIYFFDSPQAALQSDSYREFFQVKQSIYRTIAQTIWNLLCIGIFGILFLMGIFLYTMFVVGGALLVGLTLANIPIFSIVFNSKNPLFQILFMALFFGIVWGEIQLTPILIKGLKIICKPIAHLLRAGSKIIQPVIHILDKWWLCQTAPIAYLQKYPIARQIEQLRLDITFQDWQKSNLNFPSAVYEKIERELFPERWRSRHTITLGQYLPITIDTVLEKRLKESIYLDISILNATKASDRKLISSWLSLLRESGWIFMNSCACLICDRPTRILFDAMGELHGDGTPAIAFADNLKIYARHGTIIPEQYGATPSDRWSASWLLNERNTELRQMLVQQVGYERLALELNTNCIDSWREYELLELPSEIPEQFKILKMTCPSTGHLHFLTVPPNIDNAWEAACWVNWDIDPDDFAIET